jgi:putative ABC transport system substrate-binding protein
MRRIGVLASLAEDDPGSRASLAAFQQELDRLGWSQGRNVHIDFRFARARVDQVEALAKELLALQPDVILAQTTPVVAALQRESRGFPRTARELQGECPLMMLWTAPPLGKFVRGSRRS